MTIRCNLTGLSDEFRRGPGRHTIAEGEWGWRGDRDGDLPPQAEVYFSVW